jgi:tetratricopeptide (TPR) repeat protein
VLGRFGFTARFFAGFQSQKAGRVDEALALYAKSEAMRPGYPEPLLNSAHIYQNDKKDTPTAHRLYRRMLNLKVEQDPTLKITDKNHMNLYALLAVQLAREIPQEVSLSIPFPWKQVAGWWLLRL